MTHLLIDLTNNKQISMNHLQERVQKQKDNDNKERRKQFIESRRAWDTLPALIVSIPSILDHHQWHHFEEFLDALSQKDADLMTPQLSSYIFQKYSDSNEQMHIHKHSSVSSNQKLNILSLINRLGLARKTELQQFLSYLEELSLMIKNDRCMMVMELVLKLLKEIAIYAQMNSMKLKQHNEEFLTSFQISRLNTIVKNQDIYQYFLSKKHQNNNLIQRLQHSYRIFYLYLFSEEQLINISQYLSCENSQYIEVFSLIYDNLQLQENQQDFSMRLVKTIKILQNIIKCSTQSFNNKDNTTIPQVIFDLFNEKFNYFWQKYQNSEMLSHIKIFQESNTIALNLLMQLNNSDLESTFSVIELIAELMNLNDNFIPLLMEQTLPIKQQPYSNNNKCLTINKKLFRTLKQFITETMKGHLIGDLRHKIYWLISNISGSQLHYNDYGFYFLNCIFQQELIRSESLSANYHICGQAYIFILNFIINIKKVQEIQELTHVLYDPQKKEEHEKQENVMKQQEYYPSNLLLFILEIIEIVLDHVYTELLQIDLQHTKSQFRVRVICAIENILRITHEGQTYQLIVNTMQKNSFGVKLEYLYNHMKINSQEDQEVLKVIDAVLKHVEAQAQKG